MLKRTALHQRHQEAGARLVDFAGWEMPLHYGSQIEEHHAVRRGAGVFDVSHMRAVGFRGPGSEAALRRLLANDVARIREDGGGLYGCMLNEDGGVLDDLIVFRLQAGRFLAVVNAATAEQDIAWFHRQAEGLDTAVEAREGHSLLAVQGPRARQLALRVLPGAEAASALKPFRGAEVGELFVSRTGYTGEDGLEILCPDDDAVDLWDTLLAAGATPCGLAARDTLRLEAGLNLYGQDMDPETTPLESGLAWTIAWEPRDRLFIGRAALEAQRAAGVPRQRVGLILEGRGVMRAGQRVRCGEAAGVVTSGSFAPTVGGSVALARVDAGAGERAEVEIRGRWQPARRVDPPFVRHGQACV